MSEKLKNIDLAKVPVIEHENGTFEVAGIKFHFYPADHPDPNAAVVMDFYFLTEASHDDRYGPGGILTLSDHKKINLEDAIANLKGRGWVFERIVEKICDYREHAEKAIRNYQKDLDGICLPVKKRIFRKFLRDVFCRTKEEEPLSQTS